MYQGPNALDSVLNFPLYSALVSAFTIPGPLNISALTQVFEDSKSKFKVTLSRLPQWIKPSYPFIIGCRLAG